MGEQGLQSEILAQKANNYYHLYLPLETQRYIMRAIAAKIILSDPEAYGFQYTEADLYPPLQYDRIRLECLQETPIAVIAQAAGTYFKMIKDLNPEIKGYYLAAGSHELLIPQGAGDGFHTRFNMLVEQWLAENRETANTTPTMAPNDFAGSNMPSMPIATNSANWVTSAQPLRRPRKGGVKRSISGDQRNFQV